MSVKTVRQQTTPSTTGKRTVQSLANEISLMDGTTAVENNVSLVGLDTTPGGTMFWSGRDNFAGVQTSTYS